MGKSKHKVKSHLTKEERTLGKNHLYLLLGMIVIGAILGIYYMR